MNKIKKSRPEITLDKAKTNTIATIKSMHGDKGFISRASGRGLTPGAKLTIIQNFQLGPIIVYLRDSQVALGRSEAKKIIVGV